MRRLKRVALALACALAALAATPVAAGAAGSEQMWRLYNRWTGEHLFTANTNEYAELKGVGWTQEGKAWLAPTEGDDVYRLYNPYVEGGDHHYTRDENEYMTLQGLGWRGEDVAWRSAPKEGGTPLYRLYNKYAETGTHHYTASAHERDELVSVGWRYEGEAWYGVGTEQGGTDEPGGTDKPGDPGTSEKPSEPEEDPIAYYTVTFNTMGGSNVASQTVEAGTRVSRPADPTRDGYKFEGWYASSSGTRKFDFSTPINGSMTVYAHWTRVATYSYEAYYVDGMGRTWFDGSARTIYVKTNNPEPDFSLKDPLATTSYVHALGSGYFDDVVDQGQVGNFLRVPGGYLVRYSFDTEKLGRHTIEIREYSPTNIYDSGVVATTFTAIFESYDEAQNAWADDAIARYTTPDMNPLEKLRAVTEGLGDEFHYYPNHGGYRITLAAIPNSPYFISKRWDSYTSPAALCIVAERIGGFSVIDNCYDNWPANDPMWQQAHACVRVVYNGEERYYDAYPSVNSSSGEMDPSSIVMIDFNKLSSSQFQHV